MRAFYGILVSLAFSLLQVVSAQADTGKDVSCYMRTQFGSIEVLAINPFRDIKLSAVFTHSGSGASFRMPVVCYSGPVAPTYSSLETWGFEIWFTPHITGEWTWYVDAPVAVSGAQADFQLGTPTSAANPGSFLCIPSSLTGWWRPDIASAPAKPHVDPPGDYPHALVEPNGKGADAADNQGWAYVHPAQTTFYPLANPGYPSSYVVAALDWAKSACMKRVRYCLNHVTHRSRSNNPLSASGQPFAINNTVFRRISASGDFSVGNIDFSAFDLSQWSVIEGVIDAVAARGMQSTLILCMNSGLLDYEERWLHQFSLAGNQASDAHSPRLVGAPSVFVSLADLYAWYLAGRLSSYPSVSYSVGHEWDVVTGSLTSQQGVDRIPAASVRAFGRAVAGFDPYLAYDNNCKIVVEQGGRGSYYVTNVSGNSGPCSATNSGAFDMRLAVRASSVLSGQDDDWRSCVGLQRAGELGLTSLVNSGVGSGSGVGPQFPGYPCVPLAQGLSHRDLMRLVYQNDRPIFVEEDWTSKNSPAAPDTEDSFGLQPGISGSFTSADNPYAVYVGRNGSCGGETAEYLNRNAFPFLGNNFEGLRKSHRDSSWMTGVICQAHTSYFSRRFKALDATHTSISWQPHLAIEKLWNARQEWWRFEYLPGLVVSQSPALVPLSGLVPIPTPLYTLPAGRAGGGVVSPPVFGPGPGQVDWATAVASCSSGLDPRLVPSPSQAGAGRLPFEQLVSGARAQLPSGQFAFVFYSPVGVVQLPGAVTPSFSANLLGMTPGQDFSYFYGNPDTGERSVLVYSGQLAAGTTVFSFPPAPPECRGEFGEYVLFVNCNEE